MTVDPVVFSPIRTTWVNWSSVPVAFLVAVTLSTVVSFAAISMTGSPPVTDPPSPRSRFRTVTLSARSSSSPLVPGPGSVVFPENRRALASNPSSVSPSSPEPSSTLSPPTSIAPSTVTTSLPPTASAAASATGFETSTSRVAVSSPVSARSVTGSPSVAIAEGGISARLSKTTRVVCHARLGPSRCPARSRTRRPG